MINCNISTNSAPLQYIKLRNLRDLDFDLSTSRKIKVNDVIELPIYDSILVLYNNICPNSAPLQDISLQIWVTLTLTFQGRPRQMLWCSWTVCTYFSISFKSNVWPNSDPLPDMHLNDTELTFKSLKIKSEGAIGLPIYDFLLMCNSKFMSISHRLAAIGAWKFLCYLFSLGQNSDHTPGIFLKMESLHPRRQAPTKNGVNWLNIVEICY